MIDLPVDHGLPGHAPPRDATQPSSIRGQRMHRGNSNLPVAGRWTQHRAGPRLIIRCKNTRPATPEFEFIQQHRTEDLPGNTLSLFRRPQQNQARRLFSLEWAGDVIVDLLDHSHLVPLFRKRHQEWQLVQYLPVASKDLCEATDGRLLDACRYFTGNVWSSVEHIFRFQREGHITSTAGSKFQI